MPEKYAELDTTDITVIYHKAAGTTCDLTDIRIAVRLTAK